MNLIKALFGGLRGKLILTYTLVTVLALMALEVLALLAILLFSSLNRVDERSYLQDVLYTMYPRASDYLQPGDNDLPGLQAWLEKVAADGFASQAPQNIFDSPAAVIVEGDPLMVLSPDLIVLAQAPLENSSLIGRKYVAPDDPAYKKIITRALASNFDPLWLSTRTSAGNYQLAVPVPQDGPDSPIVGVILLTVEPAPPMIRSTWPIYLGWVLGTGLLLLIAVAPFGALFGLVMSTGLTRRLKALSRAADAWSEGDFQLLPTDHSRDEIGVLAVRLRNMAERIQALLHTQQQLATLEERNRLARELHDTVKQQTFATLMQVRAARNMIESDPSSAEKYLLEAETLLKTSQQELGAMISELRPAALEGQGLPGALRIWLAGWSEHSRIPANLQISDERRLPLAAEQTLYRVAQEALSNVARHSRASAVTVSLIYSNEEVRLEIMDNGVGFQMQGPSRGFGLDSMRERLAAMRGTLEIYSAPDQGTRLVAHIPQKQTILLTEKNQ